ncbi:hypothetical protein GGF43_006833, partial [Coemansia sp. RSA 2618]
MDIASTPVGPRFVKRPELRSERSRYEVVGYPKSTRAPKRDNLTNRDGLTKRDGFTDSNGAKGHTLRHQQSQPRLQGFELRVIDTHNGRAVVRTPVLSGRPQGSDREQDEIPELPPPSAAELRYNAQRALINSTAILRTAVASKQPHAREQPAQLAEKAATVRLGPGIRPQPKSLARTASERAQSLRIIATSGSQNKRVASGFQINMQFDSEQGRADRAQVAGSAPACMDDIGGGALEQGSVSVASVLEQWGISEPSQR